MKNVPANDLISVFQTMYREHWSYEWGKHEQGCVDCSGAFTYVFSTFGINFPNGSNTIARKCIVGKMRPICQAEPGMAAFKAKQPLEEGYDLPDKYKIGGKSYDGNLTDYYHIGLVDEDKNYVLNAKGTKYGFCRDKLTTDSGWDFVAYLKYVDYGHGKDEQMSELKGDWAKVVLPANAKGSTVNMREKPTTTADIITRVPVGSDILVTKDQGQWCEILYDDETGWMMSNYIEYVHQEDETDSLTAEDHEQIDKALSEIQKQVELIGSIVGRG